MMHLLIGLGPCPLGALRVCYQADKNNDASTYWVGSLNVKVDVIARWSIKRPCSMRRNSSKVSTYLLKVCILYDYQMKTKKRDSFSKGQNSPRLGAKLKLCD